MPGRERHVSNGFAHLWSMSTEKKLKAHNSSSLREPENVLRDTKGKRTARVGGNGVSRGVRGIRISIADVGGWARGGQYGTQRRQGVTL